MSCDVFNTRLQVIFAYCNESHKQIDFSRLSRSWNKKNETISVSRAKLIIFAYVDWNTYALVDVKYFAIFFRGHHITNNNKPWRSSEMLWIPSQLQFAINRNGICCWIWFKGNFFLSIRKWTSDLTVTWEIFCIRLFFFSSVSVIRSQDITNAGDLYTTAMIVRVEHLIKLSK